MHREHREPPSNANDFPEEEVSGVYEGEELRVLRARRPTAKRLERLEVKHDELSKTVTRVELAVTSSHGELTGKLDTLVAHAAAATVERERRSAEDALERERKRKHIVPTIKALGVALALIIAALIGHGSK